MVCPGRVDVTSQRRDTNTLGADIDDARPVRSVGSVRARAIVIRHALCAFNASITRLLRQPVYWLLYEQASPFPPFTRSTQAGAEFLFELVTRRSVSTKHSTSVHYSRR